MPLYHIELDVEGGKIILDREAPNMKAAIDATRRLAVWRDNQPILGIHITVEEAEGGIHINEALQRIHEAYEGLENSSPN